MLDFRQLIRTVMPCFQNDAVKRPLAHQSTHRAHVLHHREVRGVDMLLDVRLEPRIAREEEKCVSGSPIGHAGTV